MLAVRLIKDVMFKAVGDPALKADVLNLVHGEQDMEFHRPLRTWNLCATRSKITGIEDKSTGQLLRIEETILSEGEVAVHIRASMFVRDKSKIPNAVEELLRYEAPSPVQARRLARDVELYGEVVPEGAKMLLLTGSAGRDDREYEDPDRFDVDRVIDLHVSLGYGTHFCLGASLARLEGRIALEETLARFPEWEVLWDETERVHTSTVRGYAKVPIRF